MLRVNISEILNIINALLIYPELPDTFWNFKYALKFIHRKARNCHDHTLNKISNSIREYKNVYKNKTEFIAYVFVYYAPVDGGYLSG